MQIQPMARSGKQTCPPACGWSAAILGDAADLWMGSQLPKAKEQ